MHPIALRRFSQKLKITIRHASSSTNPYPYPLHANPTPQQIFHLPMDASQQQVKARYFELMKIYHPDSSVAKAYPPEVSQARFHAITHSYDVLRGRKNNIDGTDPGPALRPDFHDLSSAAWRVRQQRRADLNIPHDDRWKDSMLIGALVLTIGVFALQSSLAKQKSLAESFRSQHPGLPTSGPSSRSISIRDEELLSAPDLGPSKSL